MAIQYGAPKAPKVQTSFQTQRNTGGFRDPFPSLVGGASRPPAAPPLHPNTGSGYGQRPARPPAQQPQVNPQATAQQQAPPATPQVGYSYDADPVLNQIQALSTQGRGDAEANALGLRRQLAQQYGDENLARQYGGEAEAATAKANPNSVLAQLAHSYESGRSGLEEGLNQSNLFYSGARIKQLADLANQYQSQVAGATGQEQDALNSIASNLAAAQHAADLQDAQAHQDAYNRALQMALSAGGTGLPYDSGGTVDTGAAPTDTGGDMFAPPAEPSPFANPQVVQMIAQAAQAPTIQTPSNSIWDNLLAQLAPPVSGYSRKSGANIH